MRVSVYPHRGASGAAEDTVQDQGVSSSGRYGHQAAARSVGAQPDIGGIGNRGAVRGNDAEAESRRHRLDFTDGFISQQAYCRWLLALLFFVGTLSGLYFINCVFPVSTPPRVPLVPHVLIPLWLGLSNLTYVIGGLMMLFNKRIRRAGQTGFLLW